MLLRLLLLLELLFFLCVLLLLKLEEVNHGLKLVHHRLSRILPSYFRLSGHLVQILPDLRESDRRLSGLPPATLFLRRYWLG